jgi:hypothetical protein
MAGYDQYAAVRKSRFSVERITATGQEQSVGISQNTQILLQILWKHVLTFSSSVDIKFCLITYARTWMDAPPEKFNGQLLY